MVVDQVVSELFSTAELNQQTRFGSKLTQSPAWQSCGQSVPLKLDRTLRRAVPERRRCLGTARSYGKHTARALGHPRVLTDGRG